MAANDPGYALQRAVYSALKAHAGLSAITTRVYEDVPLGARGEADFPYVTIGAVQIVPEPNTCSDFSRAHIQIDGWSRAATGSKLEAEQIGAMIRDCLDRQISVAGFQVVTWRCESINYDRELDAALTKRARCAFEFLLNPAF